jgi:PAS domain S-box-containing protein
VAAELASAPAGAEAPVKIAVRVPNGTAAAIEIWEETARSLDRAIPGYSFELVPLVGLEEMRVAVECGAVDFVLTNPAAYVELEARYGVTRIATLRNARDGAAPTEQTGTIFTRADRVDIEDLNDVAGKSVMGVDPNSFGGWLIALYELKSDGIDPARDCREVLFSPDGTHESVVRSVVAGEVDVGTVRTGTLEQLVERGELEADAVKIVRRHDCVLPPSHSTRHYPEWPFARLRHTPNDLSQQVAVALLRMTSDDSAAVAGGYTGWTVPLDYGIVHDLLKELRVSPYEDHGRVTLRDILRQHLDVVLVTALLLALLALYSSLLTRTHRRLAAADAELAAHRDNLEELLVERTSMLRASEERFRFLIEAAPVGVVVQSEGTIVFANPAVAEMLGAASADEIIGGTMIQWTPEEFRSGAAERMKMCTEEGVETAPVLGKLRHCDGHIIDVQISSVPIHLAGESACYTVIQDVTKRLRAESALRDSEQYLRAILENSPDGHYVLDSEGRFTDANQAAEKISGYKREELIGMRVLDSGLFPPEQSAALAEMTKASYAGPVGPVDLQLVNEVGDIVPVEVRSVPLRANGETRILGSARDVTERVRAQEALRSSEKRFRLTLEGTNDGVWDWNMLTGETYFSPRWETMLGYEPGEVEPNFESWKTLVHPDGIENAMHALNDHEQGNTEFYESEYRLRHVSGEWVWVLDRGKVVERDEAGRPLRMVGTHTDITERRRLEESVRELNVTLEARVDQQTAEVREANEQFEQIFETSADMICIADIDGYFRKVNPAFENTLGYSADELLGRPSLDFVHPDDRARTQQAMREELDHGHATASFENRYRRKDGSYRWLRWNSHPVVEKGISYAIARDVTVEKEASTKSLERSDHLEELVAERTADLNDVNRKLQGEIAERVRVAEALAQGEKRLRGTLTEAIEALARAVEMRDPYTAGHQRRVALLAVAIGQELGLPEDAVDGLRMGGTIHDIGKIAVPAEILTRPGHLTEIEFALIKAHPQLGHDIVGDVAFTWPVKQMIIQHHERLDGSGYPCGLKESDICLEARIIAVADVVEAMSTHRPYRAALGTDAALEKIMADRGRLYDPDVVDACVRLFREKGFNLG